MASRVRLVLMRHCRSSVMFLKCFEQRRVIDLVAVLVGMLEIKSSVGVSPVASVDGMKMLQR